MGPEAINIVDFAHPVLAGLTEQTLAAGNDLFGNDPVSNRKTGNTFAKFGNMTNKLMAGNKRWDNKVLPKTFCAVPGLDITGTDSQASTESLFHRFLSG
jgi:hypothetical protein